MSEEGFHAVLSVTPSTQIPSNNDLKSTIDGSAKIVFLNDKPCLCVSLAENKTDKNFLFVEVS